MTISATDILGVTKSVTKEWTKQRRAEERGRRSRGSRRNVYSGRVNFTEVAEEILPDAYAHASGNGRHSVKKRQLYYAARKKFQELTDREITAEYFSQNLLRKYLNTHPETESWKIVADARGHLLIPNAGYEINIPVGMLEIEEHLRKANQPYNLSNVFDGQMSILWPSLLQGQRFQGVMYPEKEGFNEILHEAHTAERFDIAILAGKGQSTAAARRFVDEVCRVDGGAPLFVLRDFDKSGFIINKRLTTVSAWAEENDMVLYEFQNEINAIDMGLRLEDINAFDLHWATEEVPCSRNSRCKCFRCQPLNQEEYGITDAEYEFLMSGRRVELNALTSPQFIEFVESKLTAYGLSQRLIPTDDVLVDAYRRAMAVAQINHAIKTAQASILQNVEAASVPNNLRRMLKSQMSDSHEAWDAALYRLIETEALCQPLNAQFLHFGPSATITPCASLKSGL